MTLPTPVLLAGGALCIVGGFLVGVVAGPASPAHTTATVTSFDEATSKLCLKGKAIVGQEGEQDGQLCGRWRNVQDAQQPAEGDQFRFVSVRQDTARAEQVVIYGNVVN